mgnify:CR=1 FL=1
MLGPRVAEAELLRVLVAQRAPRQPQTLLVQRQCRLLVAHSLEEDGDTIHAGQRLVVLVTQRALPRLQRTPSERQRHVVIAHLGAALRRGTT